jgi:hypothetical protein
VLHKFFFFQKLKTIFRCGLRFLSFIFIPFICLLLIMSSIYIFAESECEKADKDNDVHTRCSTSATGEDIEKLEEVVMDESDKTIAVPWKYPGVPSPLAGPPVAPMTTDPAWDLIDTESIYQRLEKSEYLAVEFDHLGSALIPIQPYDPLTVKARQAFDKSPTWLQKQLEDTFSRLNTTNQDTYADLILDAVDPYVDEIAFCVANISVSDLIPIPISTNRSSSIMPSFSIKLILMWTTPRS